MLTTTWVSGGNNHTYTSFRQSGEDPDAHRARHDATVAALQVAYPPD